MDRFGSAALLCALLAACSGSASGGTSSPKHARVGQAAPQWTQSTASGSHLSLASLRGSPVYLNFFATWCGPCNEEAPYINDLQKLYAARGLRVIGVDELESAEKAREFVAKFHLVYPAVVDDGALQSQYNVNGLPVHVFIDRSGTVRNIIVGELNRAEIDSAIRAIL